MAESEPTTEHSDGDGVQAVEFTAAGVREGFVAGFPVAVGVGVVLAVRNVL